MVYIYKLYFENEPNVCYIGRTRDLAKRLKQHTKDAQSFGYTKRKVLVWLRANIGSYKLKIAIIKECKGDGASDEIEQIALYKQSGFEIKKTTNGCEVSIE